MDSSTTPQRAEICGAPARSSLDLCSNQLPPTWVLAGFLPVFAGNTFLSTMGSTLCSAKSLISSCRGWERCAAYAEHYAQLQPCASSWLPPIREHMAWGWHSAGDTWPGGGTWSTAPGHCPLLIGLGWALCPEHDCSYRLKQCKHFPSPNAVSRGNNYRFPRFNREYF